MCHQPSQAIVKELLLKVLTRHSGFLCDFDMFVCDKNVCDKVLLKGL